MELEELQKQVHSMKGLIKELAQEQTEREQQAKRKYTLALWGIAGVSLVLSVALICGTIYSVTVFREQQYANTYQLKSLMELLSGAQGEHYEAGDNGVIITGDKNETEVKH